MANPIAAGAATAAFQSAAPETIVLALSLVALLGVKDLIVVRLKDVTLVCGKDRAQEIRRLVREAGEHAEFEEYL